LKEAIHMLSGGMRNGTTVAGTGYLARLMQILLASLNNLTGELPRIYN
jgi:hypothetical protein